MQQIKYFHQPLNVSLPRTQNGNMKLDYNPVIFHYIVVKEKAKYSHKMTSFNINIMNIQSIHKIPQDSLHQDMKRFRSAETNKNCIFIGNTYCGWR